MDLELAGYDDITEIARGGFGVVYRARQDEFDRTVAVKVLTGPLDDQTRVRFERERRAIGSLSGHPNIVTVHAAGLTPEGRPYIVMEYLPGGSLADRLHAGPLPWPETVEIGEKLSGALQAAHDAGVLHRDIKPENVLVSGYGEPKLGDFGIARVRGGPETRSGQITATLVHAAPEVLSGQRPTEASDVYSLGSTLYMLVAGTPAFWRDDEESMLPLITRVMSDPVPDLRASGVPDALCELLERAMAKDPADRPAAAAELGRLLHAARAPSAPRETVRLAAPHGPRPRESPPVPRAPRRSRRPLVVAAALVALAAIVTGVVLTVGDGDGDGGADGGGDGRGRSSDGDRAPAVVATISIGPGIDHVAVGMGAVWVTDEEAAAVVRIDPETNAATPIAALESPPHGIAVGEGALWVTTLDVPTVLRIEPGEEPADAVVTTVEVDTSAAPLAEVAVGEGAVWATSAGPGLVARIDPGANEVTPIDVGGDPDSVAVGEGAVWVADRPGAGSGRIVRIDPETNAITATIPVGGVPDQVAVGEGSVWVVNAADGTVSRIDPATNAVVTIEVGDTPDGVAVGEGAVWVSGANEVLRIDPATNEVTDFVSVGVGPESIAVGDGAVWVVNINDGTVSRIDPSATEPTR